MQTIAQWTGGNVSAVLLAVTDDYLLELTYLEYVRYVVCDAVPAGLSMPGSGSEPQT
jgi:hypothetical protein